MNSSYVLGAAAGLANICGISIIAHPSSTQKQQLAALPLLILPVVGVYHLDIDDYGSGMLTTGLVVGLTQEICATILAKPYAWAYPIRSLLTSLTLAGGPALLVLISTPSFDLLRCLGIHIRRW